MFDALYGQLTSNSDALVGGAGSLGGGAEGFGSWFGKISKSAVYPVALAVVCTHALLTKLTAPLAPFLLSVRRTRTG